MEYKKQTRHNNFVYGIHMRGEDNPNESNQISKQNCERNILNFRLSLSLNDNGSVWYQCAAKESPLV